MRDPWLAPAKGIAEPLSRAGCLSRDNEDERGRTAETASAIVALSVMAGIAGQANAQTYSYSAPSAAHNQDSGRGQ
jgi:hypothetical protein